MLAVILSEDDIFARAIAHRLRLGRHTPLRYRDPVKLADNLEELQCDVLVMREQDFPLHWQLLAAAARYGAAGPCKCILALNNDPPRHDTPPNKEAAASSPHAGCAELLGVHTVPDAFSPQCSQEMRTAAALALASCLKK